MSVKFYRASFFCVTLVNIEPKHFLRVILANDQNWYQEQLREQTVPGILRSRSEHYLEATSPIIKPEVHTFNYVHRATTQTTVSWTNGRVSARNVKGGHTCTWVAESPPLGPLSPNSSLTNWVVLASRRYSLWTGLLRRLFCGLTGYSRNKAIFSRNQCFNSSHWSLTSWPLQKLALSLILRAVAVHTPTYIWLITDAGTLLACAVRNG